MSTATSLLACFLLFGSQSRKEQAFKLRSEAIKQSNEVRNWRAMAQNLTKRPDKTRRRFRASQIQIMRHDVSRGGGFDFAP